MKVYIAGKITGRAGYRQQFAAAEACLAEMGHSVMNPAWLYAYPEFSREDYIAVSKSMLARCEAVLLLRGWTVSQGAKAEAKWAQEHGLKVFDASSGDTGVNGCWEELRSIALRQGLCGGSMEEAEPLKAAYAEGYSAGMKDAKKATRRSKNDAKRA